MHYTAICIGGEADGRMVDGKGPSVHIPLVEPLSLAPAADVEIKPSRYQTYYAHGLTPDRGKPIHVLVHSGMSLRQGLEQLIDGYAGSHIPKNSGRKAEPSEVDALVARIRFLEELSRGQGEIIRDMRARLGE